MFSIVCFMQCSLFLLNDISELLLLLNLHLMNFSLNECSYIKSYYIMYFYIYKKYITFFFSSLCSNGTPILMIMRRHYSRIEAIFSIFRTWIILVYRLSVSQMHTSIGPMHRISNFVIILSINVLHKL